MWSYNSARLIDMTFQRCLTHDSANFITLDQIHKYINER